MQAQKTQLVEANQTLAALRAPATPPTAPVATTPTPATTQPTKVKKGCCQKYNHGYCRYQKYRQPDTEYSKTNYPSCDQINVGKRCCWYRQEQLKKITANIPPVTLNFETATAIAKLEEFVAKVKAASPQNIKLTATGVATNAGSSNNCRLLHKRLLQQLPLQQREKDNCHLPEETCCC